MKEALKGVLSVGRRALKFKQQPIILKKSYTRPDFEAATVLVSDPWQYVDLWLRRQGKNDARFYWEQAKQFYDAALALPPIASPLPAYYSLLNATKALLTSKGLVYKRYHGVSGRKEASKRGLRAEKIKFLSSGVLPTLARYLGEPTTKMELSLYELLYNLPYIHRAFTLTFKSAQELFIPIRNPRFVVKDRSNKAWFEAQIELPDATGRTTAKLPSGYERDLGIESDYVVRRKKRFNWIFTAAETANNLERLWRYHHQVRQNVFYINGPTRLWYMKRKSDGVPDFVSRTSLTITYAAMHRLSELARYEPLTLAKHFEGQYNWLLTEFIEVAPKQFIDEIAAEITGMDFMAPGIRK